MLRFISKMFTRLDVQSPWMHTTRLKAPGCILQTLKNSVGGNSEGELNWQEVKVFLQLSSTAHGASFYIPGQLRNCFRHLLCFLPPTALLPGTQCTLLRGRGTALKQLKGNMSFRNYNLASYALLVNTQEGVSDDTNGATECKWWRLQFPSSWGCTLIQPLRRLQSGAFPLQL